MVRAARHATTLRREATSQHRQAAVQGNPTRRQTMVRRRATHDRRSGEGCRKWLALTPMAWAPRRLQWWTMHQARKDGVVATKQPEAKDGTVAKPGEEQEELIRSNERKRGALN